MRFALQKVDHLPRELEPEMLYVSEDFEVAAHLCACGCGSKVITPLGPTEWALSETPQGPSLYPSIGNWQKPCMSHYWIRKGQVKWAPKWTQDEIKEGRRQEDARRAAYYEGLPRRGVLRRLWEYLRDLFRRRP